MIDKINKLKAKISKLESDRVKYQTLKEEIEKRMAEIEEELKTFNLSSADAEQYIDKTETDLLKEIKNLSEKLDGINVS